MINKNKLLAKMVEHGYNQKKLAKELGVSENTLSDKLNGKRFFDTCAIDKICEILNIVDDAEKVNIFLTRPSQNRDNISA